MLIVYHARQLFMLLETLLKIYFKRYSWMDFVGSLVESQRSEAPICEQDIHIYIWWYVHQVSHTLLKIQMAKLLFLSDIFITYLDRQALHARCSDSNIWMNVYLISSLDKNVRRYDTVVFSISLIVGESSSLTGLLYWALSTILKNLDHSWKIN